MSIMQSVRYFYHEFWDEIGHPYTGLPGVDGGPWLVIALTAVYMLFVTRLGPLLMHGKHSPELRRIVFTHNALLVIFNALLTATFLWCTDGGRATLYCHPLSWPSNDLKQSWRIRALHAFFVSKFVDFADTVFMVLRKKRVTGLHLFHHTIMPITLYLVYKLSPYDNLAFMALTNSAVHVIMYTYYALAALGPGYRKHLWWKKHITQLQLVQFLAMFVHGLFIASQRSCPNHVVALNFSYSVVFLPLFYSFYQKSYQKIDNNHNLVKKCF